jgi:DinB family protein
MTVPDPSVLELREGLAEGLAAARAAEREVLDAIADEDRHRPAVDGGWSPKDIQAHLAAWRRRQVERLAAAREGREEPTLPAVETDEVNAVFHAQRADWPWDQVVADADATMADLIAEVRAASAETLDEPKMIGSIMGNGPEHTLAHLAPLADRVGRRTRILDLAGQVEGTVDAGGWPTRAAAYARYNLACFHALGGRLDRARELLRKSLPDDEELRGFAPTDDDLIALRDEIPTLAAG